MQYVQSLEAVKMDAISNFLKLALIAVKLYLTKQRKEEQDDIKKEPLNYFDSKFGVVRNDDSGNEVQPTSYKQNPKRNKSNTK